MEKTTLQTVHQEQLQHDENNDGNTMQIVHALGGIDSILTNYLKHPDITLHQRQIQQIHGIITTLKQCKDKIIVNINDKTLEDASVGSILAPVIELDPSDNLLSSIFGRKRANKMIHFAYHKLTLIWISVTIVYMTTCNVIDRELYLISNVFTSVYGLSIYILWMLSINKTVCGFLLFTFDFWIKCIAAIVLVASTIWYSLITDDQNLKHLSHYLIGLEIFASITFQIGSICTLFFISGVDGIQMNQTFKIIISGLCSFFYVFLSLYYQFVHMSQSNGDDSIVKISPHYQFSLLSLIISAYRLIGLFLAKQSYATYKGKGIKATFMYIKPTLKWIENTNVHSPNSCVEPENNDNVINQLSELDVAIDHDCVLHARQGSVTITSKVYHSVDILDEMKKEISLNHHEVVLDSMLDEVLRMPSTYNYNTVDCYSDLETWLKSNGLEQYLINFVTNGYESLHYVQDITDRGDLIDIGISDPHHQDTLMRLIKLHNANDGDGNNIAMDGNDAGDKRCTGSDGCCCVNCEKIKKQ